MVYTNIFHNLMPADRHGRVVEFVRLNTDILCDALHTQTSTLALVLRSVELQETLFRISFNSFFTHLLIQTVSAFCYFMPLHTLLLQRFLSLPFAYIFFLSRYI